MDQLGNRVAHLPFVELLPLLDFSLVALLPDFRLAPSPDAAVAVPDTIAPIPSSPSSASSPVADVVLSIWLGVDAVATVAGFVVPADLRFLPFLPVPPSPMVAFLLLPEAVVVAVASVVVCASFASSTVAAVVVVKAGPGSAFVGEDDEGDENVDPQNDLDCACTLCA